MASGDSPDLGSIMNEEETLAGIRALMAVQIKKTRKAVSRLRWGARRFPLFAILPGLGAAGVAIAGGDVALILLFSAAMIIPLLGALFYVWSYRVLAGEITRMVEALDKLSPEAKAALLRDFLGG